MTPNEMNLISTDPLMAAVPNIERAQALPALPEGAEPETPVFFPGTVEQFVSPTGETMRVVHVDGILYQAPAIPVLVEEVLEEEPADDPEA